MRQSQESLKAVSTALESAIRLLDLGSQAPICDCKIAFLTDSALQYGARSRNVGLSILFISEFEERGVRKVTTGITGLWPPSVHSDVAF